MTTYILRRFIQAVVIVVLLSIAVFLMIRLLPGDPLLIYMNENSLNNLTPQQIQELKAQYGLDKSIPEQYIVWVGGMVHGDFGTSLIRHVPVSEILLTRMPITITLSILAVIVSTILGLLFGIIAGLKRGSWLDVTVTTFANLGMAVPNFWIALLLMYVVSFQLGLLPIEGYVSPFTNFGGFVTHAILPISLLAVEGIAGLARLTRTQILEVARQDYIRTAYAKGLSEKVIIVRHMLKNAMVPIVGNLGMRFRSIFSGSVVIETIWNIPGMGRASIESLMGQDYAVVQAIALVSAILVVFVTLAVDIAYTWVDPRIKFEAQAR
jgi:peptide/nickel transport system permease protein